MQERISNPDFDKLHKSYSGLQQGVWLRSITMTILFLFIFINITLLGVGILAAFKINQFRTTAKLSWGELIKLVPNRISSPPLQKGLRLNFLILGTDDVANRTDQPLLTDTIILSSIDMETGKVYLLPFPRDLWIEGYQTRINALYYYGQERYPKNPEQFPEEIISLISKQPVHETLVISLDNLGKLIDLLDGIEVEIKTSFVDEKFPRSDVDISSQDPNVLYERIEFKAGKENMSGKRALKYIRSRHAEGDEGTDLSRSQRQQAVISAIISKLKSQEVLFNAKLLGKLYLFYEDNFEKYLPILDTIRLLTEFYPIRNKFELIPLNLSIYPDDENGVIYHPNPAEYNNQWLYVIRDSENFKSEIKAKLEL